ncbi:MAG: ABC transporter permease subunit, partial [Actinomycetota bacterium]
MNQVLVYLVLSLPLIGAFAMFALGIAVIYRASRVLNLAHGAMAMVPAFVAHTLAKQNLPMPVWAAAGVLSGAALGIVIERLFVRTLRRFSPAAQTVGTVAALGLTVSVAIRVWGTTPRTAPGMFPSGGIGVGASTLRWGDLGIFVVAVVVAVAMFSMFRLTNAGR